MSNETMIKSAPHSRKAAKIAQEEKELEDLIKQQTAPQEEEVTEEEVVVAPVEEEITEAVTEEEEELSAEEKTYKKRYADLRSYAAKKEAELKLAIEEAQKTSVRPPSSEEDLEKWYEDNPDTASIIQTIAQKQAKALMSEAEERLAKLDEIQLETEREKAKNSIRKVHGDFDEIVSSDDFHDWANELPEMFQDALFDPENTDPSSVIPILSMYKTEKGLTSKTKSKDTSAAQVVKSKQTTKPDADLSGKKFIESVVNKMSSLEFEKNEEAIMEAMASGNFVYDLTGGAR